MANKEQMDAFLSKQKQWKEELTTLRAIFQKTELKEEIKWGTPAYTLNGKIVAGIAGFKNHFGIWFHQGVFLKDPHNKLLNAQEGKTKALRQWKFERGDDIPKDILLDYIQESIENTLAGKEVKPQRKKGVSIPPFLKDALNNDPSLSEAFKSLTPGKQREYAEHIASAKQEATKQRRLDKIVPMIKDGVGLHDKYKNC